MCGRYVLVSKLKLIEKSFQVNVAEIMERFEINPNVCPGEEAVVIADAAPKQAQLMTFGFTPHWAKKKMYVINARSEGDHNKENSKDYHGTKGIISKPMFRKSIRSKRCLVLADAFVEGTKTDKLNKAHLVYRSGNKRPFAMAGIWDEWIDKTTGEVFRSFAIITTAPTPLMDKIPHHRSPLVLAQEDEGRWLDTRLSLGDVTQLLKPFDDTDFNAYPISKSIKSPKNKSIDLLKPIGDTLITSYDYQFYKELDLQGMGQTTARKRKLNDQLDLFD